MTLTRNWNGGATASAATLMIATSTFAVDARASRVMASVSRFLTHKLRLKVNEAKSAVARPEERSFLGFSISNDGSERRIAPKALARFRARIRELGGHEVSPCHKSLSNPARAHPSGSVDPPEAANVPLAAVAERA
jgi:hypothetical protein